MCRCAIESEDQPPQSRRLQMARFLIVYSCVPRPASCSDPAGCAVAAVGPDDVLRIITGRTTAGTRCSHDG